jgi:Amt family ammonium transporter
VFAVAALSVSTDAPNGVAGLLEGNPHQLVAQLYGIVVTILWSAVVTFVILKITEFMVPLRVRQEDEIIGLDVSQHGEALQ